jgi:hypothetical protein
VSLSVLFIVLRIFLLCAENKKVGEYLNKRKANQSYMIFKFFFVVTRSWPNDAKTMICNNFFAFQI